MEFIDAGTAQIGWAHRRNISLSAKIKIYNLNKNGKATNRTQMKADFTHQFNIHL